jgi:cyanophycinase
MVTCSLPAVAQEQTYVHPQLFSGTLYLSTVSELTPTQSSVLQAELDRTNNEGELLGLANKARSEQSMLWDTLKNRKWTAEPVCIEPDSLSADHVTKLQAMKRGSCVWFDHTALQSMPEANRKQIAEALRSALNRGVIVVCEIGEVKGALPVAAGLDLVPEVDIVAIDGEQLELKDLPAGRVRLQLTASSLLRIGRREVLNISEKSAGDCCCDWPATKFYPEPLRESLPNRAVIDLTAARRALVERERPVFPSEREYQPRLANGSLVIVGGGGAPREVWEKFIELAGGAEARIVVLPTAVAEPLYEDVDEVRLLKRFGAKEVRVLPQTLREDVSQPEYLENLRWATGIWFGGGRQWRFVDAYWGTPAWQEIKQLVARGGVIGGSSAGATIQGDLLVRGHPLGNQIMIADGYRQGLGLLEGVAIDQHFKQRNRFDDLAGVVKRFPKIYGIGIDESTALVVQAPNRCQVLGQGSVWLSSPGQADRSYTEYASGKEFELGAQNK